MTILRIFWVWASCMTVAFALEAPDFHGIDSDKYYDCLENDEYCDCLENDEYYDCLENDEADIRDLPSMSPNNFDPITTEQQLRLILNENNISPAMARAALNTNNNPTSQTAQALFQECRQKLLPQVFQLAAGDLKNIDIAYGLKILNLLGELGQLTGLKEVFSWLWSSPNHSHPPKKTRKKQRNNSPPRWKKAALCVMGAIIFSIVKH